MIRHIVFFSGAPGFAPDEIRAGLQLLGGIPHALRFEVGDNLKIDQMSNEVDFIVYAEFADEAALAAFKAHPTYAKATTKVRPMRDLRIAADFRSQLE